MPNVDMAKLAAQVAEAVKGYVAKALEPINARLAAAEAGAERVGTLEERIAQLETSIRQLK